MAGCNVKQGAMAVADNMRAVRIQIFMAPPGHARPWPMRAGITIGIDMPGAADQKNRIVPVFARLDADGAINWNL